MSNDITTPVEMRWTGPFEFKEILLADNEKRIGWEQSGLYLHTYKNTSPKIVCYVGKAESNFWKRQVEHYTATIGGQCTIPSHVCANGTRWSLEYNKTNRGRDDVLRTILDEDKFIAVVRDGFRFLNRLTIYFCPFPTTKNDITICNVETQLIYQLHPDLSDPEDGQRGCDSKPSTLIPLMHLDANWCPQDKRAQFQERGVMFA